MNGKKYYYAGGSNHGTSSSHGFSNDWFVLAFSDKKSRDKYVEESENISVRSILRKDVTSYAANWSLNQNKEIKPRPFTDEFWGITYFDRWDVSWASNIVGFIDICNPDELQQGLCERFYS